MADLFNINRVVTHILFKAEKAECICTPLFF